MKKISLLILIAMIATSLMAVNHPGKLVRLEIVNNTDWPVMIKLEGENFGQFYYLTVPSGKDMTFTVVSDSYKRTTWACNGYKSTGKLLMLSQVKLDFVPCFRKTQWKYHWMPWQSALVGYNYYSWRLVGQEPTIEKVLYFQYPRATFHWVGLWPFGRCYSYYVFATKSFKAPLGCWFRYQY